MAAVPDANERVTRLDMSWLSAHCVKQPETVPFLYSSEKRVVQSIVHGMLGIKNDDSFRGWNRDRSFNRPRAATTETEPVIMVPPVTSTGTVGQKYIKSTLMYLQTS